MPRTGNKILLTGATGYVGGTVLDHLINSEEVTIKDLSFDLLVRQEEQARKLSQAYGSRVKPIIWAGLTDVEFIKATAANYDIDVNVGSGFIPTGAKAFVEGLARRIQDGKPAPWLLHISGCTNLADRPLTGESFPDRVWHDADSEAVYTYLKVEDEKSPYPQRTMEVGVLTAAEEANVPAVSLNTPCIFGRGKGLFNQQGIIIPTVMRYVVTHGHGYKLTETSNFDYVHVEDLADVYLLLIKTILEREDRAVGYIPTGKNGIIFPAVARVLQTEIMQRCLDAAFDAGVLPRENTPKEKEIRQVTAKEVAPEVAAGLEQMAEQGWAGHKAQNGAKAKALLGWKPTRLEAAWKQDFVDELVALRDGRRGVTMESCIGRSQA